MMIKNRLAVWICLLIACGAPSAASDWDVPALDWAQVQDRMPEAGPVVQAAPVSAAEALVQARLRRLDEAQLEAAGREAAVVRALAGMILRKNKMSPEEMERFAECLEEGYADILFHVDGVVLREREILMRRPIKSLPTFVEVKGFNARHVLLDQQDLAQGIFAVKKFPAALVYIPPSSRDALSGQGAVVTHLTVLKALRAARRACGS